MRSEGWMWEIWRVAHIWTCQKFIHRAKFLSQKKKITQADLKMWHYLNDIQLKEIEADIELLIGTDVPRAMEPWKIIKQP